MRAVCPKDKLELKLFLNLVSSFIFVNEFSRKHNKRLHVHLDTCELFHIQGNNFSLPLLVGLMVFRVCVDGFY